MHSRVQDSDEHDSHELERLDKDIGFTAMSEVTEGPVRSMSMQLPPAGSIATFADLVRVHDQLQQAAQQHVNLETHEQLHIASSPQYQQIHKQDHDQLRIDEIDNQLQEEVYPQLHTEVHPISQVSQIESNVKTLQTIGKRQVVPQRNTSDNSTNYLQKAFYSSQQTSEGLEPHYVCDHFPNEQINHKSGHFSHSKKEHQERMYLSDSPDVTQHLNIPMSVREPKDQDESHSGENEFCKYFDNSIQYQQRDSCQERTRLAPSVIEQNNTKCSREYSSLQHNYPNTYNCVNSMKKKSPTRCSYPCDETGICSYQTPGTSYGSLPNRKLQPKYLVSMYMLTTKVLGTRYYTYPCLAHDIFIYVFNSDIFRSVLLIKILYSERSFDDCNVEFR